MDRRRFVLDSILLSGGGLILNTLPLSGFIPLADKEGKKNNHLFNIFNDPSTEYRPFVRWWWNGDMVEAEELVRELRLLKEAGIGGVEINAISFPSREQGDDLGRESLRWLSDDWVSMLQVVFKEAKSLGMECDLIVGSGWPFGSETLVREERASVVLVYTEHIEGPGIFQIESGDIFKSVDPGVTVPHPERSFRIISLALTPEPMSGLDGVSWIPVPETDLISLDIPSGKHVFYVLVEVDSFASVINGAPGAAGPILNHMDREAVKKYLGNMSEKIQMRTGPLSGHLRALFTDSMELEGCNWTADLPDEFLKRRGYDLMPYLPFIMFKVGRLGAVVDSKYGAAKSDAFSEEINRVRFDFELTKAELLYERFTLTYLEWCRQLGVKSRAQAYGRGFFPLETSLGYDIPEGESWTTNWLKHRVGEEMPDDDYRRGRAYTMINRYVSSAAHLSGKKVVSCEEMTNTYLVFNTSLERLKAGSDQSLISGVTHSVWHGFNYSPPDAPYPGWIQYGSYYSENNNWWPYFRLLNNYKARISALLQNLTAYTDIAILPANYDLWGEMGVQTDPFPEKLNVTYTSLIWESICKNGGSADYTSEIIINGSVVRGGLLCYGEKEYGTLILAGVESINPETSAKLYDFVSSGGRVFCIDKKPSRSLGLKDSHRRDSEVRDWIEKLTSFPDRFILLELPQGESYLKWYREIMKSHNLPSYLDIGSPDPYFMQIRYRSDDGSDIFFFTNSNLHLSHTTSLIFNKEVSHKKYCWLWDPEKGERYRMYPVENGSYNLSLGPAESVIIVFDKEKKGEEWKPVVLEGRAHSEIDSPWTLSFTHSRGTKVDNLSLDKLQDLKDIEEYSAFSGTIVYSTDIHLDDPLPEYIKIGKVNGICRLIINGIDCGIKWYGDRVYEIEGKLENGINKIELEVVTLMGNYMKSLTNNPNAQYWTNLGRKTQELESIGLTGPVLLYW